MSRFKNKSVVLIGVTLLGLGSWWYIRSQLSPTESAPDAEHILPESLEIDPNSLELAEFGFEKVVPKPLMKTLTLYGQVEANPEAVVNLNSRVTGRVLELHAHVGQTVRRGQVLAVLDSEEIHRAEVNYAQARRKLEFAKAELERRRRLARLGVYANPVLEEARARKTQAEVELKTAESELRSAQQAVRQAQAELQRAQNTLQYTESQFTRAQKLLSAQLISQQEYESFQAQYKNAQAELQSAQANLETAHAQLENAQARLQSAQEHAEIARQQYQRAQQVYQGQYISIKEVAEAEALYAQAKLEVESALDELHLLGGKPNGGHKLVLTAPFDGRIVELNVTVGETVTPDKPIFRILNTDTVWVRFNLYPEDVPYVRVGMPIAFTLSESPQKRYTSEIQMLMPEADPQTRTVAVRCVVRNPDEKLKPNAFVEGQLQIRLSEPQVVVPLTAVHEIEGKTYVFVATDQPTRFEVREVSLGQQTDTYAAVINGLKAGERIVTTNSNLLKGMLVGEEGGGH